MPAKSLLDGLKVVEFTHMVMGPAAGLILADLGAEVIKVEPVGGDKTRRLRGSGAGYFPMYNRNKKSLAVDLKSEEGRAIALDLIKEADVFVENFRPGALDKLGFGYEQLKELNPKLIYCSEKGFLDGPYRHRTALDEVAQMMGGLAYMTGPPGRPLRAGASVIDVAGGMFGAIAVLAALRQRDLSGVGTHVSSSLFETSVFLVGQHMAQYAVTGSPAAPMPARISAWAVYDVFDTKDGEKVFVGVVSDSQWTTFCEAFGLDEWAADESLRENNQRVARRDEIIPRLKKLFAEHAQSDLMAKLEELGLPFAPIKRPEDLFDDPHLTESGGLLEMTIPDGGEIALPALPLAIEGERPALRFDPPEIGQNTVEILRSLGRDEDTIKGLEDRGIIDTPKRHRRAHAAE
ncbi:CaiB/BaiF CoA transferase family protein [Parvularcula lutaonensis]|uniref:CaiB/BaiF CoA transferase family protein n=1 Tax=Parvularcula lutaonensis TaxID=491923 RepID=A0ABV7ME20_9PROT|nr:CaiB/BaiF CoA-transferase family protein [Parvularcula lutaonensis]GGY38473.1 CoA transferase [Parvularcula lutaonensis]